MDLRALHGKQLLAAVAFVAATLVLAIQLITPSPVVVSVGENGADVAELGGYFRYRDVAIIAGSATLLGSSGTYLLTSSHPTAAGRADERTAASRSIERTAADASAATVRADGSDSAFEPSDDLLESRRAEWEETAERLADNEQEIYETVLEADGVMAQSDIVETTDLSKATVSRTLDSLETKNLLERKRRGMGNTVLLL
ncbi:helix-turn-helix transcriptional regulator [Halorhabdus amylolytica]|uniref:helix-turn-helix transcriptional regulator n=1 Tax=Halorhabdus amylolytica TaxID=2559573 RepID=UPI0010AB0D4D|nr:MarR family transcriptional regulator [Halorhabdus amylolytica]